MSTDVTIKPLTTSEKEVVSCLETLIKYLGVTSARVEFVDNSHQYHSDHPRKNLEVYTELAEDRGKIIGKLGQNINALNTLVNAYARQRGVVFSIIHVND